MNFSKQNLIITSLVSIILLSGCQCWYIEFKVFATGKMILINSESIIAPQVITLSTFDNYGNGCPPSSTTITNVEFYNGANKLGTGTKSGTQFRFNWNIVAGQDGIAATGISEVAVTAVDQTGTRSETALTFSVQAP